MESIHPNGNKDTDKDSAVLSQTEKGSKKKGFAAMDSDKRRQAAQKGGRKPKISPKKNLPPSADDGHTGPLKRGFALMSAEKRKQVASLGGKLSHGGGRPSKKHTDSKPPAPQKRGFAAMAPQRLKQVSALGGKISRKNKHS